MKSAFERLKIQFRQGSMVVKLIMINVIFFVLLLVSSLLIKFTVPDFELLQYFSASSGFSQFLWKPWTVITYMFTHDLTSLSHLFWNMIVLYFAGTFFYRKFGNKKLLSVYLAGGICGYLIFAFGYTFLPAFKLFGTSSLIGASAAVTSVLVVIGVSFPKHEISLPLVNQRIKMIYLVGFIVLLDLIKLQAGIGDGSSNAGGWLSHLGGAIFGFVYATKYSQGMNILKQFEQLLDKLFSFSFKAVFLNFSSKKLKVKRGGNTTKKTTQNSTKEKEVRIDSILKKVKNSGYDSLTKKEKEMLFSRTK